MIALPAWIAADRKSYKFKAIATAWNWRWFRQQHYVDLMTDENDFVWIGVPLRQSWLRPNKRHQIPESRKAVVTA